MRYRAELEGGSVRKEEKEGGGREGGKKRGREGGRKEEREGGREGGKEGGRVKGREMDGKRRWDEIMRREGRWWRMGEVGEGEGEAKGEVQE